MSKTGTLHANPTVVQLIATEVERPGTSRASKTLGIGREAILRILANLPVRAGTLAILRERFGKEAQ